MLINKSKSLQDYNLKSSINQGLILINYLINYLSKLNLWKFLLIKTETLSKHLILLHNLLLFYLTISKLQIINLILHYCKIYKTNKMTN